MLVRVKVTRTSGKLKNSRCRACKLKYYLSRMKYDASKIFICQFVARVLICRVNKASPRLNFIVFLQFVDNFQGKYLQTDCTVISKRALHYGPDYVRHPISESQYRLDFGATF